MSSELFTTVDSKIAFPFTSDEIEWVVRGHRTLSFSQKPKRLKHNILVHRMHVCNCHRPLIRRKDKRRKLHLSILFQLYITRWRSSCWITDSCTFFFFRKFFSPLKSDRCTFHEIVWKLRTEANVKCFLSRCWLNLKCCEHVILLALHYVNRLFCYFVVQLLFSIKLLHKSAWQRRRVYYSMRVRARQTLQCISLLTTKTCLCWIIFLLFISFLKSKIFSLHSETVKTERNCKERRFVCAEEKVNLITGTIYFIPAILSWWWALLFHFFVA